MTFVVFVAHTIQITLILVYFLDTNK